MYHRSPIHVYIKPWIFFINEPFNRGIFLDELKIANVILIYYKSGSSLEICNYKPISILTFCSNIFEKLASNQLANFSKKNYINFSLVSGGITLIIMLSLSYLINRTQFTHF